MNFYTNIKAITRLVFEPILVVRVRVFRQLHGRRLSTVTVGGAAAVRGCARHGDPQSVGGDSSRVGCELRRPQLLHRCLCVWGVCAKVISGVSMCDVCLYLYC